MQKLIFYILVFVFSTLTVEARAPLFGLVKQTCPVGYIYVPPDNVYTFKPFCVMKYEAKNDGGIPASTISLTPWVSIPRGTGPNDAAGAWNKCKSLGPQYDLISNNEWQTIARDIQLVGNNWSGNSVGVGDISQGHTDSAPSSGLAASGDVDPCAGTGQSCSQTTWNSQRRTHNLSNGEIIWDFSGNVSEHTRSENFIARGTDAWTTLLTLEGKTAFGPSGTTSGICGNYNTAPNYCGMGYGYTNYTGVITRGGHYSLGLQAGVYHVNLAPSATTSNLNLGFRCVYYPHNVDPCLQASPAIGETCYNGVKFGGSISISGTSYRVMVTPGGCNDSATPSCSGTDILTKPYYSGSESSGSTDLSNGVFNKQRFISTYPSAPFAINYCNNLRYGGYDDWYLPSRDELSQLYPSRGSIGGFTSGLYWTSTASGAAPAYYCDFSSGSCSTNNKNTPYLIRCIRRY